MDRFRTIVVKVPEHDLEMAQAYTGASVSATVRTGLKRLASMEAQRQLLDLRGRVQFSMTIDDLRFDRE
jgi:hypothetical protein